jgi:hypothetical protein
MTRKWTPSRACLKVCPLLRITKAIYPAYPLATAYQTEIDNLTKRAKASESAFLNIYKVLAEAPDPYPLLEVAVVRLHTANMQIIIVLILHLGPDGEGCRGR